MALHRLLDRRPWMDFVTDDPDDADGQRIKAELERFVPPVPRGSS
jgi:hypothetical protein